MSRENAWEVIWSPHDGSNFIRYNINEASSEICLYKIYNDENLLPNSISKNQVIALADDIFACPVNGFSDYSSVKAVKWCPRKDLADQCVLAVGLSNGRVSLLNIGQETLTNTGLLLNQEFAPKYDRTCHELSWNEQEHNLVAVGLDKVRYDNSLLVWDVEAKSGGSQSGMEHRPFTTTNKKPIYEHGSSESTLSVCWLPHLPRTLLAGQGTKWLRMLDMRSTTPKVVATTKAIFGISVDPFNQNRIATFAEGEKGAVLVWDIRHTDKALVTINQSKPVSKILWCPTRNHLLSVLQKDTMSIKYYDLQYTSSGNSIPYSGNMDEDNDHVFERHLQLPKSSKTNISSYSWHPSIENTILSITTASTFHYLKIFELITMSWSPSLNLVWGCGKHMFMCSKQSINDEVQEDIADVMRRRAVMGYGEPFIMKDERKLRTILGDSFLSKLWTWIRRSRKQRDHDSRKTRKFYGVKAIIKGDMNSLEQTQKVKSGNTSSSSLGTIEKQNKNNMAAKSVQNPPPPAAGRFTRSFVEEKNKEEFVFSRRFYSDDRKLALYLCDWDLTDTALTERLQKLVGDGEPERAAAMALFHNKLKLTIDILSGALNKSMHTDPSLPIVAMALSGYSDNKQTLWTANCIKLSSKLTNAYLRAIFAFLTADDEDYSNVLRETDMELGDRIAFSCRYLSDAKLMNYVENVTTTMITNGSLEGLLLTGLTSDGIDLLENFITKTSDIQTAILIILTSKVNESFKDPRVINWIENYRDLLDRWRLWHERAQFDSLVQNTDGSKKIPQQISVTCTYCNKPVSYNVISSGGVRGPRYLHGVGTSNRQNKAMSCPGCRQPLPRCSICLINMGSLSSHAPRSGSKPKLDTIINSFQNWFTWCQNCRHGGHAQHLMEWFAEHVECPVTGCTCCCNVQDSVAMVTPKETEPVDSSEEIR